MSLRNWDSLRQRSDFLTLQQSGQKWVTPAFVIQSSASETSDKPLVGFTVTKKMGGAVVRNRIKRRLRAMIDSVIDDSFKGHSFVIIGRSEALTRDFAVLTKDLRWALRRLGQKDAE